MDKIIYKVEYERKDCKGWRNTIDLTLEAKESIVREFGSIKEYLNKMISGGVLIKDNYLYKAEG